MAEGVRHSGGGAAWQRVRGVAEGARHGRGCTAWRRVLYFVIPRVSRGIQQLRDSTVLLSFSGCCDYAQHDGEGAQRGRVCAAWQRVCGMAEGVWHGGRCAAWQKMCGMAGGVRHGRGCAAWRRVFYFVIPRVSRGIQQLRDSTVLLSFSGCCDCAQHDGGCYAA